jgi:subtilisin family serine protease
METTGRHLLVLSRTRVSTALQAIHHVIGGVAHQREFSISVQAVATEPVVFDQFGIVVAELDPDQLTALAQEQEILAIEPEPVLYEYDSDDYLRGFQDGVEAVVSAAAKSGGPQYTYGGRASAALRPSDLDERELTWGLQAVGVGAETPLGTGIRVALIDSGLDFSHPDFRHHAPIPGRSFVNGVPADDLRGHGTHCAGTICASRQPSLGPRYAVAPQAELRVARVFDNRGRTDVKTLLAALDWAMDEGCHIVSMSLGAPVTPEATYGVLALEQAASAALGEGVLLIAAAGNDSRRTARVVPLNVPACCPSVLAVAAVDDHMQVPFFSNGQVADDKRPDIAAPGVQVYSAWPMPRRTHTLSGTSMAVPHVTGVAALHAEVSGARGKDLWDRVIQTAHRLGHPEKDVGAGIVRAP